MLLSMCFLSFVFLQSCLCPPQLHTVPYLVAHLSLLFCFVLLQLISYAVCPFVASLYLYGLQFQIIKAHFLFFFLPPWVFGFGLVLQNLNRYFAGNPQNLIMAPEEKSGDHQGHSDSSSVECECLYKMNIMKSCWNISVQTKVVDQLTHWHQHCRPILGVGVFTGDEMNEMIKEMFWKLDSCFVSSHVLTLRLSPWCYTDRQPNQTHRHLK